MFHITTPCERPQLLFGQNDWVNFIKKMKDGRHRHTNLTQVPAVKSSYHKENVPSNTFSDSLNLFGAAEEEIYFPYHQ
jgi:hypothetical protein